MKIKGNFHLQDLKEIGIAFCAALLIALFLLGFFYVLSVMSWVLVWIVIAIIVTPICYWLIKCMQEEIIVENMGLQKILPPDHE